MAVAPIQTSFLGGELSPSFHGRVDLDVYRQGARELFNVRPTVGGSLQGRQGSMYVCRPAWLSYNAGQRGKLAVLPGAGRHGYIAIFGDSRVQVRDIDGQLERLAAGREAVGAMAVTLPAATLGICAGGATVADPEGDGYNWNNVPVGEHDQNVAAYSGGSDRYTTPVVPMSIVLPTSIRLGYSGWANYDFTPPEVGTYRLRFVISAEDAELGSQLRIQVGYADQFDGSTHGSNEGPLMFETFIGLGNDPQTPHVLGLGGTGRMVELEIPVTDASEDLSVSFKFLSLHGPDDYLFFENPEKHSVCFWGVSLHCPSGVLTADTPYNEDDWFLQGNLRHLRTVALPTGSGVSYLGNSGFELLLLHPDVTPQILAIQRNGVLAIRSAGGTFPSEWSPGNYPTIGVVWQGRLWLSGCAAEPDRFWASKPGDWLNFSPPSSPPTADDAIDLRIGRERIQWMQGGATFFIGTDVAEYALTASSGVVSALDFQLTAQSGFGGAAVPAPLLGSVVGYVTADRRRINVVEFSNERGAWWSRDITAPAEHRFRASAIAEATFVAAPDPTILARLDDGTFATCLFNPAMGLAAWSLHEISGTELDAPGVTSMAVSRGPDGARAWFLVRRDGTGTEPWSAVETMLLGLPSEGARQVDGSYRVTATVPGPSSLTLLDLAPYNLRSVDVWVDGVYFRQGGGITDSFTIEFSDPVKAAIEVGSVVEWGWAYTRRVKLLGLDVPGPRGSGQATKRRSPKIVLRMTEGSSVPRVNLTETPKDFAGVAGEGSLEYVVASDDWGRGMMTLEAREASPFELLAIMQVTQANEV